MVRRIRHYSTRADALGFLEELEIGRRLWYVMEGSFNTPETPIYNAARSIDGLGTADHPVQVACTRYMVYDQAVQVIRRELPRPSGGVRYIVDPWKNAPSVHFTSGGLFGGKCVIGGLIEVVSTDKAVVQLFRTFAKVIKQRYSLVHDRSEAYFIGPEAMRLSRDGWRLTESATSSPELDLKCG